MLSLSCDLPAGIPVGMPFINPLLWPHGIVKFPLNAHLRISPEVGLLVTFCLLFACEVHTNLFEHATLFTLAYSFFLPTLPFENKGSLLASVVPWRTFDIHGWKLYISQNFTEKLIRTVHRMVFSGSRCKMFLLLHGCETPLWSIYF